VKLRGLVDREREGFRYRQFVMVIGRRIALGIEHPRRRCVKPLGIFGERNFESLAIGTSLLVSERQATQCL